MPLRYVHSYRDRHGNWRHYLRRPGRPKLALAGVPGSPAFLAAYAAAMAAPAPPRRIGADRNAPDSVAHWVALYLESATFARLASDTRRTRRNLLERFRARNGTRSARLLQRGDIERLVERLSPVVARNFLKALRPWLKWCAAQGLRPDNPAIGVERPAYRSPGYRTWPEEHVARFRAYWRPDSRQRLAFELLLNTGVARADVVRLGRQHMRDGVLSFRRHKTGVLVEIPILAELRAMLDALPTGPQLTFLLTARGTPFVDASFGTWFHAACASAGVPQGYSAHGLRKYAATVRANRGATAHELMAWFGWLSIREAERYTRDAARRQLAIGLARRLGESAP